MTADGSGRESSEKRSALARLETALDRVSGAVVRRLEQDAARANQPSGVVEDARTDEIRQRLDVLIVRLRALIAAGDGPA